MMQRGIKIFDPKRVLSTLRWSSGSAYTHKPYSFFNQVSPIHQSQVLNTDLSSNSKIRNLKTVEVAQIIQKWYFQRPFSSKPLEENNEEGECDLICKVINRREWCDETERELGSLIIKFDQDTVISVLEKYKENPETAFNFFKWASAQTDFRLSSRTYNALVRVLGQKSCIEQFWNVVAEMTNEGHPMDERTYMKVLWSFLKDGLREDAVGLFVLMMGNAECKPSGQNCALILRNLSRSTSPDIDLVYRVAEAFENGGGCFDKGVYDGIHRCLTRAGRFDEAIGVMKTMEEAGFVPDNVTYSQLVFGLCKAGTLDEACKVLDAMKELGCTPNLRTWKTLIEGHCSVGEVDTALSCFELMMESGCDANFEVLAVLVTALCSQNRLEDAYSFLCRVVEERGFKPSKATFEDLLQKLTSAEKLPAALKLADLMMNQGFLPLIDPFYKLFAETGTVDEAVNFLKKVTRKRPRPQTVKQYFSMLNAFDIAGKKAEAQELLYKSPRHIHRNPDLLFQFDSMNTPTAA